MKIEDILKSKAYPKWMMKHRVFKEVKAVKKVFSGIGFNNFEDEVLLDRSDEALAAGKSLLVSIRNLLRTAAPAKKTVSTASKTKKLPTKKSSEVFAIIKATNKFLGNKETVCIT